MICRFNLRKIDLPQNRNFRRSTSFRKKAFGICGNFSPSNWSRLDASDISPLAFYLIWDRNMILHLSRTGNNVFCVYAIQIMLITVAHLYFHYLHTLEFPQLLKAMVALTLPTLKITGNHNTLLKVNVIARVNYHYLKSIPYSFYKWFLCFCRFHRSVFFLHPHGHVFKPLLHSLSVKRNKKKSQWYWEHTAWYPVPLYCFFVLQTFYPALSFLVFFLYSSLLCLLSSPFLL